jgi:hypothetical protein
VLVQPALAPSAGSARGCPRRSATPCSWKRSAPRRSRRAPPRRRGPTSRAKRADHQRLQRVRPGHALAQHPAFEAQRLGVAHPRTLDLDRPAGRLDRPRLVTVAVGHRLLGALIAPPTEDLADLVLQRLLQDQPSAEPADRLDRIDVLADPFQRLIKLPAKPLAGGYSRHAGVPPSASTCRSKRRLRPPPNSPG